MIILKVCVWHSLNYKISYQRLIDAEVDTGSHVENRVFIPRLPLLTLTDSVFPFILKRRQFPIRPAFSIKLNMGQGQSLETVGISLSSTEAIFVKGQPYFALSRVQNPRYLKIMVCGGSEYAGGGVFVKNVVYRGIFLTPVEKPLFSCSNLISSFSQVDPILSSHCVPVFSPVKRGSLGDYIKRESHSDVIALEDARECLLLSNKFLLVHLITFSVRLLDFPRI